jgi:hypothetical protein
MLYALLQFERPDENNHFMNHPLVVDWDFPKIHDHYFVPNKTNGNCIHTIIAVFKDDQDCFEFINSIDNVTLLDKMEKDYIQEDIKNSVILTLFGH